MARARRARLADLSTDELAQVMPLLEDVRLSVARLTPQQRRLYHEAQESVVAAKQLFAARTAPPPPAPR